VIGGKEDNSKQGHSGRMALPVRQGNRKEEILCFQYTINTEIDVVLFTF